MPPQCSSINWRTVTPDGASTTPGRPDPSGHRKQVRASLVQIPLGAVPGDIRHPVEGFHVVDQGGPPEKSRLGGVGRPVSRQAPLSLYALQHAAFLAADIGAGAAPQMDPDAFGEAFLRHRFDFPLEQRMDMGILVPQIDINVLGFDDRGGKQGAVQDLVGRRLEAEPVLERPGFSFVGIDRQHPRLGRSLQETPFPRRRKSGSSHSPEIRRLEFADQVGTAEPAIPELLQRPITAGRPILV